MRRGATENESADPETPKRVDGNTHECNTYTRKRVPSLFESFKQLV